MATVLLVDDDPMRAHVRRLMLGRFFPQVERAVDVVEAFILVEDPAFCRRVGLVVVGLNRPGLSSPVFVAELTSRLPSVPVLVLGQTREEAVYYPGPNVRFLPHSATSEQILAVSRQMIEQYLARVA